MADDLAWARDASIETARLVAGFEFPDFEQDYEFVALSHPGEYALTEGRLVSNKGLDIPVEEFGDHFLEQHVKHSNALQCRIKERGAYLVGPLARFNLNFAQLPQPAQQMAAELGLTVPVLNPFRGIIVRAIELIFACEEALRLIGEYEPPASPRIEAAAKAGVGHGASEAPRGTLYHRYEMDDRGLILKSQIVPPTAQNQRRMEEDLWHFVPQIAGDSVQAITARCEQAVRNYDPCISCATHYVKIIRS
jgi:coenzyme F420-reducing hydrogenase alpha subunit